jgi:hypothetical protein
VGPLRYTAHVAPAVPLFGKLGGSGRISNRILRDLSCNLSTYTIFDTVLLRVRARLRTVRALLYS